MQPPEPSELPNETESPPILLIGGSVRAAAESAARAGIACFACDHYGDRETLAVARGWIQLDEFAKSDPKPELLAMIVGGTKTGLGWMEDRGWRFRGVSPLFFAETSDPKFLSSLATDANVKFPAWEPFDGTKRHSAPPPRPRWLIKRRESSGGLGVRWIGESEAGIHATTPETLDRYLQQYVHGRSLGATFVSDGQRALLLGICRPLNTRLGDLPFVYSGSAGPVATDHRISAAFTRLAETFVQQSEFTGPFNIDVVDDGTDVWLLEINPRFSASMELVESSWMRRTGRPCSVFESVERWHERLEEHPPKQLSASRSPPAFIKRVLFAKTSIRLDPNHFAIGRESDPFQWKDVPSNPTNVEPGMPIATLIADRQQVSLWEFKRMLQRWNASD